MSSVRVAKRNHIEIKNSNLLELHRNPETLIMKIEVPALTFVPSSHPGSEELQFEDFLEVHRIDPKYAKYLKDECWYKPALPIED